MRQYSARPVVTTTLIAINVLVYLIASLSAGGLGSGGRGDLMLRGELWGPAIGIGNEYWRIVTSGFLHAGLLHLAMNMIFIWVLGSQLEPALGRARFTALYFTCLLCGSLGSLLIQPNAQVVGASGAAFGLLGAAIVLARRGRLHVSPAELVPLLIINLAITFAVPGIAVGGHVGGVVGGFVAGFLLEEIEQRSGRAASVLAVSVLGVAVFGLSIVAAGSATAFG